MSPKQNLYVKKNIPKRFGSHGMFFTFVPTFYTALATRQGVLAPPRIRVEKKNTPTNITKHPRNSL
ncbi:hypothetical protein HMPREF1640_05085 [Prevotella sp. S7-1-8]|nr:hypothetical protein HMPREF1640_05085 [Prevotella sp. S7-1-8]